MKYTVFVIGLIVLAVGAVIIMPESQPAGASPSMSDTEFNWRECSGPNGERNPAALPLYKAVFANDKREVNALLSSGASSNALLYPDRWSPLMVAIAYNNSEIVRLLVEHGADLNYVSNDPATGTPLAAALNYGRFYSKEHPDIYLADHLLDPGVDTSHPDFSIFYYLLDSGADMNVEFNGVDIAIYAVVLGRVEIANDLLARGYRHDLRGLRKALEIRRVTAEMQPEKDKALATVDQLLAKTK